MHSFTFILIKVPLYRRKFCDGHIILVLFMQCYAFFEKWVDYQRPFLKCHFSDKTTIINNTERRITKRGSHMLRYNQLIVSTIRYIAQT